MTFFPNNAKLEKRAQEIIKEVPQYFHSILYSCWAGDLCSTETSWDQTNKDYSKLAVEVLEKRTKELMQNIKIQNLDWLSGLVSDWAKTSNLGVAEQKSSKS